MRRLAFLIIFYFCANYTFAQPVEVRADYNAVGDVDFVAYNNTKAPLFVYVILGDLENTYYRETLPIVKRVDSGFNSLFTLERDLSGNGGVRFHHEIKYFRSDPVADVDLDFPYLIPFEPNKIVQSVLVKDINGFMGLKVPKSWTATGFKATAGDKIFAARNGIIVEITGAQRDENATLNYNGWKNTITILQPDGTLACYRNVTDSEKKWKVGENVYAGQMLGEIVRGANELIFLIYHETLPSGELIFIVPQFQISEDEKGLVLSDSEFSVVHPAEVRGLEMDKKEKRRFLK